MNPWQETHLVALRELIETEMELSAVIIERAERARGRRRQRLYEQAAAIGPVIDRDLSDLATGLGLSRLSSGSTDMTLLADIPERPTGKWRVTL